MPHDVWVDEDDCTTLLDTFHALLALKPQGRGQTCPYQTAGGDQQLAISPGLGVCGCQHRRPIYSTDALRIHERFFDFGPNGGAFGWSGWCGSRCCSSTSSAASSDSTG